MRPNSISGTLADLFSAKQENHNDNDEEEAKAAAADVIDVGEFRGEQEVHLFLSLNGKG